MQSESGVWLSLELSFPMGPRKRKKEDMQEVGVREDECLTEMYGESAVAIPDWKSQERKDTFT